MACVQGRVPGFAERIRAFSDLKCVGDTRTIGLVAGLELVQDKTTKTPFDVKRRMGLDIFRQGLEEGIILRPMGDVAYLYLPLCVTDQQLEIILDKTYGILEKIEG